jgi:MCP family monocarboxylic acid transporter-like MFS transporter 14
MASGFVMAGASFGGLVGPPLYRYLLDEFGLRGAMMIICGLLLNGVVVGALLRPLEFYQHRTKRSEVSNDNTNCKPQHVHALNGNRNKPPNTNNLASDQFKGHMELQSKSAHAHSSPDVSVDVTSYPLLPRELLATRKRQRTESESNRSVHSLRSGKTIIDSISESSVIKYGDGGLSSVVSIHNPESKHSSSRVDHQASNPSPSCCGDNFLVRQLHVYRSLMRNSRLMLFLVVAVVAFPGLVMVTTYIVPHAVDQGVDKTSAAMFVSIICGLDFLSRIMCGFLADQKWIKRHWIIAISLIIVGTASNMLRFLTEYWGFVLYIVVYGLCGGAYMAVYPVLLVEFVGIDNLPSAISLIGLAHGLGITAMSPAIGE